jgi:hypothetical protein
MGGKKHKGKNGVKTGPGKNGKKTGMFFSPHACFFPSCFYPPMLVFSLRTVVRI